MYQNLKVQKFYKIFKFLFIKILFHINLKNTSLNLLSRNKYSAHFFLYNYCSSAKRAVKKLRKKSIYIKYIIVVFFYYMNKMLKCIKIKIF